MNAHLHRIAALALLTTATAVAQVPQRIIGLTRTTPIVLSQDVTNCNPFKCAPVGFPAASLAFAGGTAYDATDRGAWISDGLMIAKVDTTGGCNYLCKPVPMPNTTPNNPVTGLAYNEFSKTLWVTDAGNVIRWYQAINCTFTLVARCIAPVPTGSVLTGIATDDLNRLVFYSAVTPGAGGGIVYVASQATPCAPFCKLSFTQSACGPLGPLTGVGYEPCRRVLWVTDGKTSVGSALSVTACSAQEVKCCTNPTGDPYIGLCIVPSRETSHGKSCTSPVCPNCPTMTHMLGADPTIGNPAFSLDLVQAPANSSAYLVFNAGPCAAPGLGLPIFCGPILVPFAPPPIVLGPIATGGGVGCTGSAVVPLAIPAVPALCGQVFSSQYVGLCVSAIGSGSFVSNCLSWMVSGS